MKPQDVALLCNPQAGGRWRVLAEVLDSDEAKGMRRIVTDEIEDVREAIASLGQRVRLLCIYGGDGTIYQVVNELMRDRGKAAPRLAFLGGGTMNVTAAWCGMRGSPAENFRQIMRAHDAGTLLWREVPLLAVTQNDQTRYGFTFGAGPLVRILERYEAGRKSRVKALEIAVKSTLAAVTGTPRDFEPVLRELEAQLAVDDERLPYDRFSAVFANVTGMINVLVAPFTAERTRATFHFLAYAVSVRELAVMVPLLARGVRPIDARSLIHPVATWRKAAMTLVGRGGFPPDPRYVNGTAQHLALETGEPLYTIDGEVLASRDRRFDVRLGPAVHVATLRAP